jgi:hypothetical protein
MTVLQKQPTQVNESNDDSTHPSSSSTLYQVHHHLLAQGQHL